MGTINESGKTKYVLFLVIFLLGIGLVIFNKVNEKTYTVIVESGEGIWTTFDYIQCDSVDFVNKNEVYIWNNGSKTRILSDNTIRVKTK